MLSLPARVAACGWLVLSFALVATAEAQPAAEACSRIEEAVARLACYDRLFPPKAATQRAPSAAPQGAAAAVPAPAVPTGKTAAQAVAELPAAAPAAAEAADGVSRFGLTAPRAAVAEPSEIRSIIQGRFDGWRPDTQWRLANGQVWAIADGSSGAWSARTDPRVRITRGLIGGFFIEIDGVSQSPKVRRLE